MNKSFKENIESKANNVLIAVDLGRIPEWLNIYGQGTSYIFSFNRIKS